MRTTILNGLVIATIFTACGDDGSSKVPPRVIEGGGIGDGPIDGVANIYVIDDKTRDPIAGATVKVGTVEGTTDSEGLFVIEDVKGPQTIVVKAATFRSEMWVGANGTNMTFDLGPATDPVAPKSTLTGSIDLSSIQVPAGHLRVGVVFYSQTDDIGDVDNEIKTADDKNVCNGGGMANPMPCAFTIDVRGGRVALLAAIYDRNLNGTPNNFDDDTSTLIRWAYRGGITVTPGVSQASQDLTLVDVGMMGNITVDFGSPPTGLQTIGALIGIDLGTDGVFQIGLFRTPTDATLLTPKLPAVGGTSYRLTAVANNGTDPATTQSIVLRRALTGPTLTAGTWLAPPAAPVVTRTSASWTAVPGATVQSVEYTQGTANLLNVSVFDGSTQVTVPDLVALPAGMITAAVNAIGAEGLDVTEFSLDADRDKLNQVSGQTVTLN
ncbi:hypothetical protein BH11MYX3_BH11MYX3_41150 [soil metagenome]